MKRIAITLAVTALMACAGFYGAWVLLSSLDWYAACTEAQVNQYFVQHGGYPVPYSSSEADLRVAAACGVQHGSTPVGAK